MTSEKDNILNILSTKIEEIKIISEGKNLTYKSMPLCSYISVGGKHCTSRCILTKDDPNPKCAKHINAIQVKQCAYIDNDIQCDRLTRAKSGLCHYHGVLEYNREKAKIYYQKNKDKISKEKKLEYALKRADRLMDDFEDLIKAQTN